MQFERRYRAYTLIELLIVLGIMSMLLALLMPALNSVRNQAKTIVCASNLRSVGIDFAMALNDPDSVAESDQNAPQGAFILSSFVDKTYHAGAYYPDGSRRTGYVAGDDLFFCPTVGHPLEVEGAADGVRHVIKDDAVLLKEHVSYGFNARLRKLFRYDTGDADDDGDFEEEAEWWVMLGPGTTHWQRAPRMPLVIDVDPAKAPPDSTGTPHIIAPPVEELGDYYNSMHPDGPYWFPSQRHAGTTNLAMLDGSVRREDRLSGNPNVEWRDADWTLLGEWVMGVAFIPESGLTATPQH